MNVVEEFNGLNGCVATREQLEQLIVEANQQGQSVIAERLQKVLDNYDSKRFTIEIDQPAIGIVPDPKLNGPQHENFSDLGLGKVDPEELQKQVTDLFIKCLKSSNRVLIEELKKKEPKKTVTKLKPTVKKTGIKKPVTKPIRKRAVKKPAHLINKNTKKRQPFKGLKGQEAETADPVNTIVIPEESPEHQKTIASLKDLGFVSASEVPEEAANVFVLSGEIGKFIQKIQPHKALILIKGTKHTSKSQLAMQLANAFGEIGKPVAYIDYEQGGMESKDTVDSVNRNTTEKGRKLIAIKGYLENPMQELQDFCKHCKVIVADSVTDLKITADQLNYLRNNYPEVIWCFISQVKENGEMYGGNKMAHNPTCIIKCHPSHNPEERYATLEKNRGNDLDLKYSMFHKNLVQDENNADEIELLSEEEPQFSFEIN